jgi:UDP-N-acetylmuramate dehydrogenase
VNAAGIHILEAAALQPCNTLALAAQARALVRVAGHGQLLEALAWAADRGLAVIPLGEGSNVVIAGDLEALVLRLDTRGIDVLEDDGDSVLLQVAAGENWHTLVQWSLEQGFFGLENLALIPGTAGAAPIQNIGAYGVELAPFVHQVHCLTIAGGDSRSIAGSACQFGYRDSVFKHALQDKLVITAVELRLSRRPKVQADYPALARALEQRGPGEPTPRAVYDAVVDIRRSRLPDPSRVHNAGSFFKNPVLPAQRAQDLARQFAGLPLYPQPDGSIKLPAAWLIDFCGWKGYRQGGLGVHPEHALVLVNYGNDNGADLLSLARAIADSVLDTFDIALEIEPRIYGRAA